MRIKKYFKIILSVLIIFSIGIIFSIKPKPSLSEERAFAMFFGNYDSANKSSIWKNMRFPDKEEADDYWKEKTGIVKSVFFQPYNEDGKKKIFLLTKTIPKDFSFDCHACLPLIGAAVFVLDKSNWIIESQNLSLMYAGEYGEPLMVKLIAVGKNKFGLSVEFEHIGEGFYKEMVLVVPYNNKIENAHQETIYYENFNDCGRSMQCAAFTAQFGFDNVNSDDFYGLKIRRFGTETDKTHDYNAVPVDINIVYKFINGKYLEISRKGFATVQNDEAIICDG